MQKTQPDRQKIGDRAVHDAVAEIARGAAEEKREACGIETSALLPGNQQPGDESNHQQGADDECDPRAHAGRVGKETEGDAGIVRNDEAEIVGNHLVWKKGSRARLDPGFAGAVKKHHQEREPEPAESTWNQHEVKEVKEVKEGSLIRL